jgi:hypothetical protein
MGSALAMVVKEEKIPKIKKEERPHRGTRGGRKRHHLIGLSDRLASDNEYGVTSTIQERSEPDKGIVSLE